MKLEMKRGNKKIGKDTLIFNMCPASRCPSRLKGLCQLENPKHCYALRSELQYPNTWKYRSRQERAWNNLSATQIAMQLYHKIENARHKTKYVMFNESGDFNNISDYFKLEDIAVEFPKITFYGYTARKDLMENIAKHYEIISDTPPDNLIINGSGFMLSNEFRAVDELSGEHAVCKGDCRKCNLCKKNRGIIIEEKVRK